MGTLKQLLEYVRHLFTLTQSLEESKVETAELRQEVEQLTELVRHLTYELRYALNNEKHEREKHALEVENKMLRFERRLHPSNDEGQDKGRDANGD